MPQEIKKFVQSLEEKDGRPSLRREKLEEMAVSGEYPCSKCDICDDPEKCGTKICAPWYLWFQCRWQNIKKAARR